MRKDVGYSTARSNTHTGREPMTYLGISLYRTVFVHREVVNNKTSNAIFNTFIGNKIIIMLYIARDSQVLDPHFEQNPLSLKYDPTRRERSDFKTQVDARPTHYTDLTKNTYCIMI